MIQQRKMSSQKAINGKERGGETGVSGFIIKSNAQGRGAMISFVMRKCVSAKKKKIRIEKVKTK